MKTYPSYGAATSFRTLSRQSFFLLATAIQVVYAALRGYGEQGMQIDFSLTGVTHDDTYK